MSRLSRYSLLAGLAAGTLAAQCPCPATTTRTSTRSVRVAANANSADRVAPAAETRASDIHTFTLSSGTPISVRLEQSLDTKYDRAGAPFVARVSAPVTRDGEVVVPRGALCRGHVVESKPSGRLKGRAQIWLDLDSIETHGRIYYIATGPREFTGKNHKKRNLAWIGGGAGTGAGIGAIAGGGVGALIGAGAGTVAGTTGALITGKRNLHLAPETPVVFTLHRPITMTERVVTASR